MYHYKLQVLILSQDNRIYDAVSALEPLAGFEHELLLRQSADAAVKTADVSEIAITFGGGGHLRAAGCTIEASLPEAQQQLLKALKEKLV